VLLAAGDRALTAAELWAEIDRVASRDKVASAIEAVEELAPFGEDDDDDADRRAELVKRYATVRPFLPMLTAVVPFGATDAGAPVLAAARSLPDLAGRKRVRPGEVDGTLVTGSWRRLVLANPDLPAGTVDHRAYTLCVLEQLHRALRRRDVYAAGSVRWGDPRARLLSGEKWEAARPQALAALRLEESASVHLAGLGRTLDVAWRGLAARFAEASRRGSPRPGSPTAHRRCALSRTQTARSGSGSRRWRRSPSRRRWSRCEIWSPGCCPASICPSSCWK
jgi:hypothetical protein